MSASGTPTRVRWFLLFWIFLLAAIAFLDRVNISIAVPSIANSYQLSDVRMGTILSSFLWGYLLLQTLAGRMVDKFGPRRILAACVVWWGLFTTLTALVPAGTRFAVPWFVAIRFLLGAGEAAMFPASNQFLARWIPKHERGLANGLIFAGVGAGSALSPPLISYVILRHGWRVSFWVCAVIGLVAGLVWYLISRDTPAEHPRVSRQELDLISSGLTLNSGSSVAARGGLIPWSRVLTSKDVLAVTLSYFSFGYVAWIFFSWFYTYLAKVRGLNLKASALYDMLPFVAMAICCIAGGKLSDALTRSRGPFVGRCVLACVSIFLAGIFVASGSLARDANVASLILAGGAGVLYLSQSSFWSVTADLAGNSSGSVSGFMNMGAQLGGALTAQLTPWIARDYGWTASFLVAAGLCVIGSLAWLVVDPHRKLISELGPTASV